MDTKSICRRMLCRLRIRDHLVKCYGWPQAAERIEQAFLNYNNIAHKKLLAVVVEYLITFQLAVLLF